MKLLFNASGDVIDGVGIQIRGKIAEVQEVHNMKDRSREYPMIYHTREQKKVTKMFL